MSSQPLPQVTTDSGLVMVVDDDPTIRMLVSAWLEHGEYRVASAESGAECLAALGHLMPDVICLDVTMPGMTGIETLEIIRTRHPHVPVVMLTADAAVDTVVAAMNLGAYDYLVKPIDQAKLTTTIRHSVERARLNLRLAHLEREAEGRGYSGIIGQSPAMRTLFRQMDRVAARDITVLIQGESGSGQELVARAIHEHSGRKGKPFVALNCAAIPETLQESELFGYEKGAFTGAASRRVGRFEQANGGTLFLDEVGELSLGLQAKLLRVIQERSFHRVGGSQEIASDFRLLAATHRPLDELVAQGSFREDFYFRIAVFELDVPPLRDRDTDIALLARHFADSYAREAGQRVELTPETMHILERYVWPGNVRELENAIHRAVVVTAGEFLQPADLPVRIRRHVSVADDAGTVAAPALPPVALHRESPRRVEVVDEQKVAEEHGNHVSVVDARGHAYSLEEIERVVIIRAIARNGGNMSNVVRDLGLGRTTLYRKLKKYAITR